MHNGAVSDFTHIRREMTELMSHTVFANIHGSTDSEHLAALYMTHLTNSSKSVDAFEQSYPLEAMAEAMQFAVATTIYLQREVLGDSKRSPNSLNLCATDGEKIIAYRFRNHATSQPPSLYYSAKAGVTLNRKYPDHPDGVRVRRDEERMARVESHGAHLIIASEPSTYKTADWSLIGKNQRIMADAEGTVLVEDVPYEDGWDAVDAKN
jgi:glutamine amidotransferase